MSSNQQQLPFRPAHQTTTQQPHDAAAAAPSTTRPTPQKEEFLTGWILFGNEDGLALDKEHATIEEIANATYVPHSFHHLTFNLTRVPPQYGAERDVICSYLLKIVGYEREANEGGKVLHEYGAGEEVMLGGAYRMVRREVLAEYRKWRKGGVSLQRARLGLERN